MGGIPGMGGGGSSGGSSQGQTSTNTVQQADPWSGAQPSIQTGYYGLGGDASGVDPNSAQATAAKSFFGDEPLAGRPNEFYGGQTYADFSPETNQALEMQTQGAQNPSPVIGQAEQNIAGTLGGDYLQQGNPYIQDVTESALAKALPSVQSQFGRAGRSGSSPGAQGAVAREVSRSVAPYAAQSYENERRNQLIAAGMAPQTEQLSFAPAARLADVGGMREDQQQRGINEEMARFSQNQQDPWQRAMALINTGYGAPGGSGSSTTTGTYPQASRAQNALGGALGGAGMGSAFGPMGALLGGAGGGLMGGFM